MVMPGFHVAPIAAESAIRQLGLLVSHPNPRWEKYGSSRQPAGVYCWDTLNRAERYARNFHALLDHADVGLSHVWRVDLTGLIVYTDPVLGSQGAIYVTHRIEPNRLELT